jgi:hypothetical protein
MRSFLKKKRKLILKLGALFFAICIYPLFVILYTWSYVAKSDLEAGGNGPLDAYRHTLASSVVSYTLGEWAVDLITDIFESKRTDSSNMDKHNNRIGEKIGSHVKSFKDLEPSVRKHVLSGTSYANDPNQTTWLGRHRWHDRIFW